MSPTLKGISALEHFERDNEIKIRNGIMFDFYLGLLHVHMVLIVAQHRHVTTHQVGKGNPIREIY